MLAQQQDLFDPGQLAGRLMALGLPGETRVEPHDNRSTMVSLTPKGVLRVHRGYAYAPDAVLTAIVTFVTPGVRRDRRRAAEQAILAFPIEAFVGPPRRIRRRRPRAAPGDRPLLRELANRHAALNERHFGGTLSTIPFRLSRKMRRKLGEIVLDVETEAPREIVISHRHLVGDGWEEAEQTLLHEMVHQWQAETGRPVDHGAAFRRKAREVGVTPRAMRSLRSQPLCNR